MIDILSIGKYKIKFHTSNGFCYADIFLANNESFIIQLNGKNKVIAESKARLWISEQELLSE